MSRKTMNKVKSKECPLFGASCTYGTVATGFRPAKIQFHWREFVAKP
jgi:hypothetical protein